MTDAGVLAPSLSAIGLRRHQLLRLSAPGWARLLDSASAARDCLAHWAAHDLPLVVARQRLQADGGASLALGLPAPARWARQRLELRVSRDDIRGSSTFPAAREIAPLLAPAARAGWCALNDAIAAALGVAPRVYGSFGWQWLTGLACVRDGSDLDLLLPVADAATADAVTALLHRAEPAAAGAPALPRLDGELEWPDGSAVAWREWRSWRAGGSNGAILVKRIDGVALETGDRWLATATTQPAGRVLRPVACTR